MKHIIKSLVVISFILAGVLQVMGGNRSGTVSEQFLKIGTSARAIAMGGAQVGIADGVSSIAYNPAGMLAIDNYGFAATYTAWFADINHEFLGVAKTIPGLGVVGAS